VGGRQEQGTLPSITGVAGEQPQQQQQQQGAYNMPGILSGMMPGLGGLTMPPLSGHQHQQQHQQQPPQHAQHPQPPQPHQPPQPSGGELSMPPLMGMLPMPGVSGAMHQSMLMGLLGGMPNLQ